MSSVGAWTCPACGVTRTTAYCPECGERPFHPRDLTLRGLFDQAVAALSNVDGRVLRSFRFVLTRPGALTLAYLQGRRKPFIAPLQLFFLVNVLFFAVQSVTGAKVFSTTLDGHLHVQIWSALAQRMADQRIASLQTTMSLFAPRFDQAVVLHAKSLIILMVPPFALLPALLFRRSRRPFAAHVVFSLHFHAFLLALFCLLLGLLGLSALLGGPGLDAPSVDRGVTIFWLVVCALYLGVASGVVYDTRGLRRVLATGALAAAVACIVLGYRLAMFLLTLYTT